MTQVPPPDKSAGDVLTGLDLLQIMESIPPHVQGSSTIRAERIGNVVILHVIPPEVAARSRLFNIDRIDGDTLLCTAVDDATFTVTVAKPPELQQTLTDGTTIDGFVIAYDASDSTGQTRTSTATDDEEDIENQVVIPPWTTGERTSVLWARYVGDTGLDDSNGEPVAWLVDGAQAWSRQTTLPEDT